MLFGRRKPGYTTTVDAASDPEQVILDLQKAEMAAKKKPKAEVFDIDAASENGPPPEGNGQYVRRQRCKARRGRHCRRAEGDGCSGRKAGRGTARSQKRRLHRTPPKSPSC